MQSSSTYYEKVAAAAAAIADSFGSVPDVGVILGTGLDGLSKAITVEKELSYSDIPGFPESTVQSHAGTLLLGTLAGRKIVAMQGRAHIYEGYSSKEVTLPIRALAACGIKTLIVSNASGGMNPAFRSGDIMLIEDHINLTGHNPLEGPNEDSWGPRFPDMSDPYPADLRAKARAVATELDIKLHEGVYISVVGPNLETRAEYRMLHKMGADVVGMSTVPEVIVANHMGVQVVAFSVITDECFPDTLQPISIEDVLAAAARASDPLSKMLKALLPRI
ncbi:MAG: purine-nucleoside phosphorylase [Bacteroidetes bacterium]|nr:purine-nucleoside phosphorylase [Bacteroidota bacterium]